MHKITKPIYQMLYHVPIEKVTEIQYNVGWCGFLLRITIIPLEDGSEP